MLALRLDARDGNCFQGGESSIPAEEKVFVRGHERAKEKMAFRGIDGFLVHVLVLLVAAAEHHVLFGKIFVG